MDFLAAGMASFAFAVQTASGPHVLRIALSDDGFRKDALAHRLFAGAGVPVPPLVAAGPVDDHWHYAIAPRCAGTRLSGLQDGQRPAAREAVLDVLEVLARIDVTSRPGWGPAGADGTGPCGSWPGFLATCAPMLSDCVAHDACGAAEIPPSGEIARWREEMLALAALYPGGRWLVHGDFAPDNVIIDGGRVTCLLDWAEFGYGDCVYDLATLEFHDPSGDWAGAWRRRMAARGVEFPGFDARLRCSLLHIGLSSMALLAALGQVEDFRRVRGRTRAIARPQSGHSQH